MGVSFEISRGGEKGLAENKRLNLRLNHFVEVLIQNKTLNFSWYLNLH